MARSTPFKVDGPKGWNWTIHPNVDGIKSNWALEPKWTVIWAKLDSFHVEVDGPLGLKWTVNLKVDGLKPNWTVIWSGLKVDGRLGLNFRASSFCSWDRLLWLFKTVQFHYFGRSTFIPWDRPDSFLQIVQSFPFGPSTFGFQGRPLSQTVHF